MEIRAHLTDEELMQAVTNPSRALRAHLDLCRDCCSELRRLRRGLEEERAAAVPSEEFWQQQRMRIWQRIQAEPQKSTSATAHLAWAALAAMLTLGSLWISDAHKPVPARPVNAQLQINDDELMIAVERVAQTDMPEALEPASLLAREISPGTKPRTQVKKTEAIDEN